MTTPNTPQRAAQRRSDPKRSASNRAATLANRSARAFKTGALRTTRAGYAK